YSGDYHYTDGVKPVWGDVYMNLFQQANPDNSGSVATANMFTATFGNLATPLPLGKAFNLKVVANRMNKDSAFVFPQTAATYTYSDGKSTPALDRTDGNRFITDGAAWTKDTFDLPVYGGDAGSALIQVANPFMAYLDITAFLSGNSAVIGDSYKIWNGLPDKDIIDVYTGSPAIDGQRLIIVNADNIPKGNLTLIPPLQSFFVEKNDRQATVSSLTVSSAWATTQGDSPYTLLRSGAQPEERNLLRIKATQGNHTSSTLLCFDENASPAYCGAEDSRKLFFSEIPLSAYSLTPSREPLAINANGNYTANTALGLLMAEEGEVRLDFSGMATFGYDVYLIDNDRNGKAVETDLQKSPYYTFTAVKRSPSDAMIELNDRFSLRMEHRSTDTPAIPREASDWNVSTEDGIIRIRSAETITNLQIYNANGQLIYRTNAPSTSYEIRAPHQHLYIIKARIGETYKTRKIVGSEQ
ncbi:MAG: T9SS type A sorting domain-containing protein, partial [Tannerellaceae bacterium]|nr:T9SS type A sorting domain-containing protein [Tannerellaceae bacterium]